MAYVLIPAVIFALIILTAYICYRMAFYSPDRVPIGPDEYPIPDGEIYEPFREQMVAWMKETRALDRKDVSIRSFDGLTLRGYFYEYAPGAPIELMMHGYRGAAERDLCGGVQRAFSMKRSVLLIDQRACGRSDGHIITFGINEHRDCLSWVDFLNKRFDSKLPIILTGISMGAATVMMAAGQKLPENVVGVIADCGYTSPKEIIQKVIRDMRLPPKLAYPFVKLGARLFGHFDLEEFSSIEAMRNCKIPVFFVHGAADDFVPCEMSIACSKACAAENVLLKVPGAGHGLAYLVGPQAYADAVAKLNFPSAEN
ncbi:MAG: alpha/beta hydrolase [Ruminococcaceae bacterium]|nr:alpha/beta hydrolase [Oscillospiraceae bacterium]